MSDKRAAAEGPSPVVEHAQALVAQQPHHLVWALEDVRHREADALHYPAQVPQVEDVVEAAGRRRQLGADVRVELEDERGHGGERFARAMRQAGGVRREDLGVDALQRGARGSGCGNAQ